MNEDANQLTGCAMSPAEAARRNNPTGSWPLSAEGMAEYDRMSREQLQNCYEWRLLQHGSYREKVGG